MLTHLTPYAGIPRTLNALYLAKELLAAESPTGADTGVDRRSE